MAEIFANLPENYKDSGSLMNLKHKKQSGGDGCRTMWMYLMPQNHTKVHHKLLKISASEYLKNNPPQRHIIYRWTKIKMVDFSLEPMQARRQ